MKKNLGILFLVAMPVLGFAANGNIEDIIGVVKKILGLIMPLLLSLAVIYFVWALINYIREAGEKKEAALQQMIWGIIILFVMVSVWGLVNILKGTTDLDNTVPNVEWEVTS